MPITIEGWRKPAPPALSLVDPATTAGQQPDGVTGKTLVMSEEFNGTLIDTDIPNGYLKCREDGPVWAAWYPDWPMFSDEDPVVANHTNTGVTGYYQRNRVSLSSGSLKLDAINDNPVSGKPYSLGMLQSLPSFTIFAGHFMEVRVQMSLMSAGVWPAAWASAAPFNTWPPEIDYFEAPVSGSTLYQNVYNPGDTDFKNQTTVDMTAWHTYGCNWQTNTVTFYRDGVQTATVSRTLDNDLYLILDMATFNNPATFSTASMFVDYIRVWQ